MEDVARGGRTVLFVSHNMGAIQMLCRKTMLLKNGRLVMIRDSGDAIARYLSDSRKDREGKIRLAPTGRMHFLRGFPFGIRQEDLPRDRRFPVLNDFT
jgi:lipopolysaccharide transport system ATP-binding protein